ncbi:YadA-like family protein [Burkholderia multivorans]|uniref:YadA-like family protein n=1 Tax=Burkholderia multivorans TaxID=87883 RepID=UPI002019D765|nr:YadA-like family protein [Burkholderia multivorans]MCO1370229.1 YadA-like family protein [Burkholderia multivorans]MCO1459528.1 YadA-like family protein [Burkholderia multivorans]MCO1467507.1 YadA-like family protein [Burkholderia multivorans]UQO20719.1 YadA-like family protein [Burkholderia multivorans]UQO84323.1 YadA-like family protein [Burkholderia multivorans]
MNKTYRNIFNATAGTWTAAAETAKSRSKGAGRVAIMAAVIALMGATAGAHAADACKSADVQDGVPDTAGVCSVASIGTMGVSSIGTTATLTDDYIKVNGTGTAAVASGSLAIAVGVNAQSTSSASTAIGAYTVASNFGAIALGGSNNAANAAQATGAHAIAIGEQSKASGSESTALGFATAASGTSAIALGNGANATLTSANAIGAGAQATGNNSSAVGGNAIAANTGANAFGNTSAAYSDFSTALGHNAAVGRAPVGSVPDKSATGSVALGYGSAVGTGAGATATSSVAIGAGAKVGGGGNDIANSSVAIGASATVSASNAVALGSNSVANVDNTVSVGKVGGERKVVNMAAGTLSATSTEAVNGSQLYATNQAVTTNATNITNMGTRITANETSITSINKSLAALTDGSVGLVQQSAAGANLTLGADTDGAAVSFADKNANARTLTGVKAGALSATSSEAVNGSQLYATNQDVAKNTTDITSLNTSVSALDTRVTVNEGDIKSITQTLSEISGGTAGLVQQSAAGADLTVGANTDGTAVSFVNNSGTVRTLTGLADGNVAKGSSDAVNGSQLFATNEQVTKNASDITTLNTSVTSLGDRVTTTEGNITTLQQQISNGSVGLVLQDADTHGITVAAGTGGGIVDFAGTDGTRKLTGVANGTEDTDAVTLAQLKASGLVDPNDGRALGAVVYDDIGLSSVTLGGTAGTVLKNVAPGLIAAGSMEAVNGGQLYAMQQDYDARFGSITDQLTDLNGRVDSVGNGSGSGGGGGLKPEDSVSSPGTGTNSTAVGAGSDASGSNSTAVGQGSNASGSNSTAIGQGSAASGSNSTAVGQGSTARGNNSVALGQGAVADRDNSVSVGSAGNERQITNVAAGTAPTDAVNVLQMNNKVDSARRDAYGGTAAAMAIAGLPQSTQPGRTFMAIGGGTYGGEYGTAIGMSYMTRDGKWVVKGGASASSRGEVGASVGAGFYW